MPTSIQVEVSFNGINFGKSISLPISFPNDQQGTYIEKYTVDIQQAQVKAIRFKSKTIGTCPLGHLGEGEKSWMFMDEIEVK